MVKNPLDNPGHTRNAGSVLGGEDPLEEGLAIISSILAWRVPWAKEPGRLQSVESQKIRQD